MKEPDDDVDNTIGDAGACGSAHGASTDPDTSVKYVEESGESTSYCNLTTSCDSVVNGTHSNIKQLICNIPNGVSPAINNNLAGEVKREEVHTMPACIDCNRVTSSGSALEGRVNGLHLNGNGSLSDVNGVGSLLTNNVNVSSTSECSLPAGELFSSLHDNLSANCDAKLERRSSADRRGARWRDDSSSSDTGNEGEDGLSADECCIYTYKGDQMADLPSSFFRMDGDQAAARVEPRENHGPQSRTSSPEMDFLEMDFDPGPSCEQDSDQYSDRDSLRDDEVDVFAENQESDVVDRRDEGDAVMSRVGGHSPAVETAFSSALVPERNVLDLPSTSSVSFNSRAPERCPGRGRTETRRIWAHHGSTGDLCTLPAEPSPLGEPSVTCPMRWPSGEFLQDGDDDGSVDRSESEPVERAMIWTEEEARTRHVTQIGPSACGATAVINALTALGIAADTDRAAAAVSTRPRRNSAPLADYLASRSEAGAAHGDLIRGLDAGSAGRIAARFFPLYPRPAVPLAAWLASWIARGAVPIATLNLQRGVSAGSAIPDAWHHQMVYGAGGDGGLVWLTNPLEAVREAALWPQLASAPVLRVRRADVTSRWWPSTDLRPLVDDPRWRRLNVLGQVVNVVREHVASTTGQAHVMTQHVTIPARYASGVTLAVTRDSAAHVELLAAPELVAER